MGTKKKKSSKKFGVNAPLPANVARAIKASFAAAGVTPRKKRGRPRKVLVGSRGNLGQRLAEAALANQEFQRLKGISPAKFAADRKRRMKSELIPLPILEKRLAKLSRIVAVRKSAAFPRY